MTHTESFMFDEYTVDVRRRQLLRGGELVAISSKNFDLLLELISNDGRILTHEELLERVWDSAFVEHSNLKKGISAIRQVLGESPDSGRFIKTVPRRGYSFVAPVKRVDATSSARIALTEFIVEEEIIDDEPLRLPPAKGVRRMKWLLPALLVIFAVAIGLYVLFLRHEARERMVSEFSIDGIRSQRLNTDGDIRESGIAADGKFVAFASRGTDGRESLWLRRVGAMNAIQLVPADDVVYRTVRVSPDGDRVYYGTLRRGGRDELYEVGMLGGQSRKVLQDISSSPTFSPDGKYFAFARDKAGVGRVLSIFSIERNEVDREILTVEGDNHGLIEPRWSPDGRSFSFLVSRKGENGRTWSLNEVDVEGKSTKTIVEFGSSSVIEHEWLPDGSGFLISKESPDTGNFQIFKIDRASAQMERLTNDPLNYPSFTMSRDGRTILVRIDERRGDIWCAEWPDIASATRLTESEGFSSRIATMPDGWIIGEHSGDGERGLVLLTGDGLGTTPFLDANADRFPSVSRDGSTVLFVSARSGAQEIWSANISGGSPKRLTDEKSFKINPRFSPDGRWIYFERYLDHGYQIVRMPVTGGEVEPVRSGFSTGFDFSPDGQSIVFGFRESISDKWKIGVAPIDSPERPSKVFDESASLYVKFTPDGKSLVFNVAETYLDGGDLWLQPLNGEPARKIFDPPGEGIFWVDFSKDGKLYFTKGAARSRIMLLTIGDQKKQ